MIGRGCLRERRRRVSTRHLGDIKKHMYMLYTVNVVYEQIKSNRINQDSSMYLKVDIYEFREQALYNLLIKIV